MEAALANGEWISQYDTRLLCGTGLGQSGAPVTTDAFCAANGNLANYNAQVLFEVPNTGVAGTTEAWDQCRSAPRTCASVPPITPTRAWRFTAPCPLYRIESILILSRLSKLPVMGEAA